MAKRIRVCILGDGEEAYRTALKVVISTAGDLECVGSLPLSKEGLRKVNLAEPDVVLMAVQVLGTAALASARQLKTLCPQAPVVVVSGEYNEQQVLKALRSGVLGFLRKGTPWNGICQAVRDVYRGGMPLSAEVKPILLKLVRSTNGEQRVEQLTAREQQIVALLGKRSRNKEIAIALEVSVPTVRTHLRAIYLKLHVHSRSEAICKLGQTRGTPLTDATHTGARPEPLARESAAETEVGGIPWSAKVRDSVPTHSPVDHFNSGRPRV